MAAIETVSGRPTVSVIVPARNEETCLGACLESLLSQTGLSQTGLSQTGLSQTGVSQTGIAFEIIVVDDHSTDRTREVALSFSGNRLVRVIDAGPLPPGWTGKNNAVTSGYKISRGDWLLFTDADTIHLPGSLARSLAEAGRRHAAMLSYSPQQIVKSFSEKAIMPVIFAELAASFRPTQVSDPKSPAAAANGQYILIAREAYDAVGGHAAIAGSLLEDVALARAVKRSGRKIFFRYGGDAVRTRMYRDFKQLRDGWTKNLALLFPSAARLAALRSLEFVLIIASFVIGLVSALRGHARPAFVSGMLSVILYAFFMTRIRRAHFSWDANLLAIFGLPLFSCLLLRSARAHAKGSVCWKGRNYSEGAPLLAPGH